MYRRTSRHTEVLAAANKVRCDLQPPLHPPPSPHLQCAEVLVGGSQVHHNLLHVNLSVLLLVNFIEQFLNINGRKMKEERRITDQIIRGHCVAAAAGLVMTVDSLRCGVPGRRGEARRPHCRSAPSWRQTLPSPPTTF